jgi:hypothetical protein
MLLPYLLAVAIVAARQFSICGFSSGAFMTTQMHFAYSKDVISAGVVAGGPYYCSLGSYQEWRHCEKHPEDINKDQISNFIRSQEDSGLIDPTSNLRNSTLFIFHGKVDSIIYQGTGRAGYELYKNYISEGNIQAYFNITAEHTWPSDYYGGNCTEIGIENCGFDGAGKILSLAYGELKPREEMIQSNLRSFKQADYVQSLSAAGMAEKGFIYIPTNCQEESSKCKVHIFLHGCIGNYEYAGDYYIKNTGLNQWAEGNDIIIIYPQTAMEGPSPVEENGCWDVWGYTGDNFASKTGIQMKAIYDMAQNPPIYKRRYYYSPIYTVLKYLINT